MSSNENSQWKGKGPGIDPAMHRLGQGIEQPITQNNAEQAQLPAQQSTAPATSRVNSSQMLIFATRAAARNVRISAPSQATVCPAEESNQEASAAPSAPETAVASSGPAVNNQSAQEQPLTSGMSLFIANTAARKVRFAVPEQSAARPAEGSGEELRGAEASAVDTIGETQPGATVEEESVQDHVVGAEDIAAEDDTVVVGSSRVGAVAGQPTQSSSTLNAGAVAFAPPVVQQATHQSSQRSIQQQPQQAGPVEVLRDYNQVAEGILIRSARTVAATSSAPEHQALPVQTDFILYTHPALPALINLGLTDVNRQAVGGAFDCLASHFTFLQSRYGNNDVIFEITSDGHGGSCLAQPNERLPGGGNRVRVMYTFRSGMSTNFPTEVYASTIELFVYGIALIDRTNRVERNIEFIRVQYVVVRPALVSPLNAGLAGALIAPVLEQLTNRTGSVDNGPEYALVHSMLEALRVVWDFALAVIVQGPKGGFRDAAIRQHFMGMTPEMHKALAYLDQYENVLAETLTRVMQVPGAQALWDAYMARDLSTEEYRELGHAAAQMPAGRAEDLRIFEATSEHFHMPLADRLRGVVGEATDGARDFGRPARFARTDEVTDDATAGYMRPSAEELPILTPMHQREQRGTRQGGVYALEGQAGQRPRTFNVWAITSGGIPCDNPAESVRTVADNSSDDPEMTEMVNDLVDDDDE